MTTRHVIALAVAVLAASVFAGACLAAAPARALPPAPPLLWSDTYLGSYTFIELLDVAAAPDGSTYSAGKASHPTDGWDAVVVKHKPTGERAWVKTLASATFADEQATAVATSKAGIVVATGRYRSTTGTWGVLTAAWSSSGKRLWVKRLPRDTGGLASQGLDVLVTPAGDSYVTGVTVRSGTEDLFVARYSPTGKLRWMKHVAGSAKAWDQGTALAVDSGGNVYAAGSVTVLGGGRDHVLVKFRPDGRRLWLRTKDAGQGHDDWANAVAVRGGFVMLAGGANDPDGDANGLVARYDTKGSLWWWGRVDWLAARQAEFTEVGVDRYGHTIVAGWKDLAAGAGRDAFVARYEPWADLDWEWFQRGDGASEDRATGLAVTAEGEIYVAGFSHAPGTGYDVFAYKLRPGGMASWMVFYDRAGADDGALALSLGPKGVCLAGMSGGSALVMMYGKEGVAP